MKSKQHDLLRTALAVVQFLETYPAIDTAPALQAARVALQELLRAIREQSDRQAEPLPEQTQICNATLAHAAAAAHVVARLVRGYALTAGRAELAARVTLPESAFRRGKLTRRCQLMRQVLAAANEAGAELEALGFTPEQRAAFAAQVAAAEAALGVPRATWACGLRRRSGCASCFARWSSCSTCGSIRSSS